MQEYLKKYDVCLTTLSPVFVGSGREIQKKEYIFWKNKTMGVIDLEKMMTFVRRKRLTRQFEEYMINYSKLDLRDWLVKNRVNVNEVQRCMRYTIDQGDTVLEKGNKTKVMEFMRDPYGMPYIPGSTLKGMFRTVLLAKKIMDGSAGMDRRVDALDRAIPGDGRKPNRTRYLKGEIQGIETEAFHSLNRNPKRPDDAVNDELSGFIVSDSEPIDPKQLVLCQKIDRHLDGTEKTLPLLRECLKPETKIHFTITIDERILHMPEGYDSYIDYLMAAVEEFGNQMYENFLKYFKNMGRPLANYIFVGGGTGFLTKTIIYPAFGKEHGLDNTVTIFRNTGVPDNHGHYKDPKIGVSPHVLKCTHYQGRTYQMGKCRLEITGG